MLIGVFFFFFRRGFYHAESVSFPLAFGNIQMGQVNERSLSTLIETRLFFSLFGHVGHIARNNLKFAFVSPICKYIIFEHTFLPETDPSPRMEDKIERRERNQNSLSQVVF